MAGQLQDILDDAAKAGLIAADQAAPLAGFLSARHVNVFGEALSAPPEDHNPNEDSEMPRFIRGYHDILITIGVVITLVGLGGLASAWAAFAAVIILAEIFVKRQRLALPSFALTLAFVVSLGFILAVVIDSVVGDAHSTGSASFWNHLSLIAVAEFFALGVYYWRYRVPFALAALIVAAVATLYGVALLLFPVAGTSTLVSLLMLLAGAVLVIVAVRFDLTDPQRITPRSDVAFWLYLVAVPAILRGVFDLVMEQQSAMGAAVMISAVLAMIVFGLLLDRRAFVTAGLVYLGYAFGALLSNSGSWLQVLKTNDQFLWIFLAIGIIVLAVGFGWRLLRQALLASLPQTVRAGLPIMR